MKQLTFYSEHSYGGADRPELPLVFHGVRGDTPPLYAVLDTGAAASIFQMSVASLLGIWDVTGGRPGKIQLADGSLRDRWIFPAQATILGHRVGFDVSFCPDFAPTLPNILGMNAFAQVVFAVEHANTTVYA